jgi:AbrB family looped-hinge helix DNA binding protein
MTFHTKGIHLAGTVTIGPKGQVVIPVETREKMGVMPGDKLIALYLDDHKTVSFVTEKEMQTIIDRMGSHLTSMTEELSNAKKEGSED